MKTSKNSRLALSIAGALCSLPLFLTNAHAFGGPPGGPFSNGSYFPNDGTFSAVVRGTDTIGTIQFSTTSGSGTGAGSTGVSVIYYDGDTYFGNSQGSYDPNASTMTVNFQAAAEGQGQNTIDVKTPVTTSVDNTILIYDLGSVTPRPYTYTTSSTTLQNTRKILYFDSLYLNGAVNCQTSNSFPNQKFSGTGQLEFQHLVFNGNTPFLDASRLEISVTGIRLSNTSSTFNTAKIRPPSVNEFSVLVQ